MPRMYQKQATLFIIGFLIIAAITGWGIVSAVQSAVRGPAAAGESVATKVQELLHPTPTIYPDPVSVCVNTFGTAANGVTDEAIEKAVCEVFNFKPAQIIKQLNLLRPIYSKTTNYGHFCKESDLDSFTWERTDKVAALKAAVK